LPVLWGLELAYVFIALSLGVCGAKSDGGSAICMRTSAEFCAAGDAKTATLCAEQIQLIMIHAVIGACKSRRVKISSVLFNDVQYTF
jgi:hypothetical protein